MTGFIDKAKRIIFAVSCIQAVVLCIFLGWLEWLGGRGWFTSVLLFAPPQVFAVPALCLLALAVPLLAWRAAAINFLAVCVAVFLYGHYRFSSAVSTSGKEGAFTLVSHNIGQGNPAQFSKFIGTVKPDVILLQDTRNRVPMYTANFPDFDVAGGGEFACISRYLIQSRKILPKPNWRGRPVMARFSIFRNGQSVALYSVHMPTPRAELSKFLGVRGALAMFGNEDLPTGHGTLGEWNTARIALYKEVAAVLAAEKDPFIVAGDFNMSDHGIFYHTIKDGMTDAFAKTGKGWGYTFPGGMRSMVSLLGPWLRIDYIFVGRGWKPLECAPEPGRRSQHCAVRAVLASDAAKP